MTPLFVMQVLGIGLFVCVSMANADSVSVVKSPPTPGANPHYVGNRSPLVPNPLIKLPIGTITPKGWLRGQLVLEADGFSGRLTEISPWCKFEGSAWASPKGEGANGWEELPYWLKGFGDLGYVLKDPRITAEARKWIDAVLASQEADGYFGPRGNRKKHDLWPNMPMLNALQSFYEATGDERVLPFMTRFFTWQSSLPRNQLLPDSWQKVRAGDNIESVYWLYNRTGEPWLLELARALHQQTIRWDEGVASWHGVNIAQGFREPAVYYVLSKDRRHLDAAERNYQTVLTIYGQVPGGMYGSDENCRPGYHDPRQGTETCSFVEMMHSQQMLLTFTGDPLHADRCEDVAFNSFPPSMTPDLKALHYLVAPNQTQLDKGNKSPGIQNGGCMFGYDPHDYRCCQHNVAMGWPYYAEHLWMATRDSGLAAVLFAACQVKARAGDGTEVTIDETTDYPFAETVTLAVSTAKPAGFPLYLRIPQWCEGAKVAVNGEALKVDPKPLRYVRIDRTWADGDKVRLELPMRITTRVWRTNADSVSIDRGPLTYSLRIGEKWVRYGGTDAWPAWEIYPTTPWNYGLILNETNPAESFKVVTRPGPLPDQPFKPDNAPVELIANGKQIPAWQMDHLGLVGPLQNSPAKSDQPAEQITLIPMGCARVRISAFPTIGEGPQAHEWVPPPPMRHTASHINDDINAVSDGTLPKSSNDQSVPRFTWWNHLGTREWITWSFDKPRQVAGCELYWFDDTGAGQCRVPASWRLFYRSGRKWKDVSNGSGYGTQIDRFNRVTFDRVQTDGLKIEVTLQKDFSGGIFEWKVE
jgi:hypothetical protein